MTTVNDVLNYIYTLAPAYMKEDWDNIGLLCGKYDHPVKSVLVALDPFEGVCREAAAMGADLIVTHHPLIFQAPQAITDDNSVGRSILLLAQHGISAINAHTNLDCAPGGVNDVLARTLELQDIQIIDPAGKDENGNSYGLLRCGYVDECPLDAFLAHAKGKLGTPMLRFVRGDRPVRKVAVGGGACSGMRQDAINAGCDAFVTSDIGYNNFWDAQELGLTMIDAGHFHTENPSMYVMAQKLRDAFPDVEVVLSQKHADCMKFY